MTRRILAIVVLYKIRLEESVSYRSLRCAAEHIPSGSLDLAIMVYDNTPFAQNSEGLPSNVTYFRDPKNTGLATAYNTALTAALEQGFDWLLTLDQDTGLPLDTFSALLGIMAELDARPDVAAIVPKIRASGRIVSPLYFAAGAWPSWFAPNFTGVPEQDVWAFNSGSVVRVSALRQIGGYSPWFWLDQSDSSLYKRLSQYGKRVYVAGSIAVEHDFSMLNLQERISAERYRTILASESAFWDLEMNALAGLERTMRLAGRMLKHWRRSDRRELHRLTLETLGLRLFRSREYRLERWRKETRSRLGVALRDWRAPATPMVSVCMAAYNGERYIEAQLSSILPQLSPSDEIVIVEDCSRDGTLELLRGFQRQVAANPAAPNLVLVEHVSNRGVVPTFEDSVRAASGDILFLCDDDDIWAPDKVRKVLDVFAAQPRTTIVCTGFSIMDEHGQPHTDAYLEHWKFTSHLAKNLFFHNYFQGSTMAFRSSLLKDILPFPADRMFLHDAWIGTRNSIVGGETAFIDEPLLIYRRHTGNFSRRLSPWAKLKVRLQLIDMHLRKMLGELFSGRRRGMPQS